MLVRNKMLDKAEYKGRPTEASNRDCPCKPCYSPHDCGYIAHDGKWVARMVCLTRHSRGCPAERVPIHVYTSVRGKVCLRCGCRRK